uniref:epidermal growth factor receptor kinase substrate 8-like protein 1 n=2 Tax=Oncorhynchus TaxID=8016 RepID=UPI001EAF3D40|nr:epidermal growth factor receptor kinase substrate 8-like protein 1 [Oncorhynchus gorbuscha]
MSGTPPPVRPRKPSGVRVMPHDGQLPSHGYAKVFKVNGASSETKYTSRGHAEREVEILNHCFDDVERFMGRLQQAAEAQSILNQTKRKSRKSKKKEKQDGERERERERGGEKSLPPPEVEFVDIFQKVKYSFCFQDRLKSSISEPSSGELVHHVFIPLGLMVKTTDGPEMGATVVSPALTSGAVSLLQKHLTDEEKELWSSLGPNWTLHCSQLVESVPPYSPVFLDGWQPEAVDPEGQLWEDPIKSQHKQDALQYSVEDPPNQAEEGPSSVQHTDESDGSELPPEGERMFSCSYGFVARNSSELSVLQGETLEVIESSNRWWKCRNNFDQIGFVPFNILEPLSALNNNHRDRPVALRQSKKVPSDPARHFSYTPSSREGANLPAVPRRPHSMSPSMTGGDRDKGFMVNDELLQRLANGRAGSIRPLVIPRTTDTSAPLDYHSPPAEVEGWLRGKGFTEPTVTLLGRLTGAELFALSKEDLRMFSPEEGARVYSQMMVQKALLEDVRKSTELETMMEKQKQKADFQLESRRL